MTRSEIEAEFARDLDEAWQTADDIAARAEIRIIGAYIDCRKACDQARKKRNEALAKVEEEK